MLSEKNVEAVSYGPEHLLFKFVNLPHWRDADTKPVEEFRERFGDLFPGSQIKDYRAHVSAFRGAWHAKKEHERAAVSDYIKNVLNRSGEPFTGDYIRNVMKGEDTSLGYEVLIDAAAGGDPHRPALTADFSTGEITVRPETLLDFLAKGLLDCHDRLAICERKGCEHPYYVKTHARQQFCSVECAKVGRKEKKQAWWAKNRDKFIEKWRKQRKAARRSRRSKQSRKRGR